jgi:hypothetical protein
VPGVRELRAAQQARGHVFDGELPAVYRVPLPHDEVVEV